MFAISAKMYGYLSVSMKIRSKFHKSKGANFLVPLLLLVPSFVSLYFPTGQNHLLNFLHYPLTWYYYPIVSDIILTN